MTIAKIWAGAIMLLSLCMGVDCSIAQPANDSALVVQTVEGPVRGVAQGGVQKFLGIPYALAPVGDLRWTAPQPVEHWTQARDASQYGPICAQITTLGPYAGPANANEDCLYLNVFTTGNAGGFKKPVIVWIHGGANYTGESNDYDGSRLAQGGKYGVPSVVVTFNYRLGLFGTFSHPAINAQNKLWGNYGVLDQRAVLQWVQRNIARFGGDPARVALGGQSAGSYDTGMNMLSPLSKGLFNRAIFQSSPAFTYELPTEQVVTARGERFAKAAGCSDAPDVAKCLRALSAARILQIQGTPSKNGSYAIEIPFVDGTIVPMQPEQAWKTGAFNKMPIMGGATRDEFTFFTGIWEYLSGDPYAAPINANN